MRPNESPNTRASEGAYSPEHLHVCFHCSGELAYPLDWMEEGPRHWRIILRCPDCESRREGVFEQGAVERLDDELDRAASLLLGDLKRMTHANTLMSTVQELGAGLGVAVGALLVRLGGPVADSAGLGSGPDAPFRVAFVLLAVLLVLPAVGTLRLPRTAASAVTGGR